MTNKPIPEGIMILAVLAFIGAFISFFIGNLLITSSTSIVNYFEIAATQSAEIGVPSLMQLILIGILLIAVAVFEYLLGRGLLKAQKWARIALIVLAVLGAILAILSITQGSLGSIFSIIVDAIIIWYLVSRKSVKQFFH